MPPKTKSTPLSFNKELIPPQKVSFMGKAAALIVA